MAIESAVELIARPDGNGRMWIAADSLVDLFEDMASNSGDGPVRNSMANLAAAFRPMSTYAEMEEELADDDLDMQAYRCASCAAVVIAGKRISGELVVIDAEPVPNGELFPLRINEGVPTMAPWRPGLDGVTGTRLTEHFCSSGVS